MIHRLIASYQKDGLSVPVSKFRCAIHRLIASGQKDAANRPLCSGVHIPLHQALRQDFVAEMYSSSFTVLIFVSCPRYGNRVLFVRHGGDLQLTGNPLVVVFPSGRTLTTSPLCANLPLRESRRAVVSHGDGAMASNNDSEARGDIEGANSTMKGYVKRAPRSSQRCINTRLQTVTRIDAYKGNRTWSSYKDRIHGLVIGR